MGQLKVKNPHYWRRDAEREAVAARGSAGRELASGTFRAERKQLPTAVRPVAPALADRSELVDLAATLFAANPVLDQLVSLHIGARSYRARPRCRQIVSRSRVRES